MPPKSLLLIVLLFNILPLFLGAQEELSTKSKKAKSNYEKGEELFRQQKLIEAKMSFQQAIEEDPNFFEAYMMIGEISEKGKNDSDAVAAYRKALEIDPDKYPPAFLFLADIEYKNGWYTDAVIHYKSFLDSPKAHGASRLKAEKNSANCNFAISAIQNPVPFSPVNLGPNINTELNEYFPCMTADNRILLFTRLLPDDRSISGRQEDFFISYLSDGWQPAKGLGPPINSIYNEGAPTLSADGSILIFTACESVEGYGIDREGYGRCDLFVTKRSGNEWLEPYNIGMPVNSKSWESQPSISADGRTIYFVSNRNNNYDIWFASVNNEGKWSEPQKLGPNINTEGYEGSVFIHPDNQTLYFSSDGHVGMGGLDIFLSRKDSTGQWGIPVNLGYPINSHKDDNSILINAGGNLALFASDRRDGYGGLDLYSFELYDEVRPQVVTYMKGTVFDKTNGQKLGARFELTNLKTGEVAIESFSNKATGEFLVCLPADHEYALTVLKDGYLFYSENFNLTGENPSTDPVLKDVPMVPMQTGAKVVMKNVFFETGRYDLLETSKVELDILIGLLNQNPDLKIEIGGHTDNVGKPEYNLVLSDNRARSVMNYLIENGISADRLSYKGYGETQPVDTNDTEEGRANNRRTEFKVVE